MKAVSTKSTNPKPLASLEELHKASAKTVGGNHPAIGCDFSSKEANELGKDVNLS